MDYKLLLDTAVMAGESCWKAGRETWRVEDTMLRMLRMSGLKTADVLALTTGFGGNARRPGDGFHDCYAQRREPCNGSEPDPCGQSAFPRFLRRKYRPGCAVPPGAGYLSCQVGN
mgnify:CR=1 FL=1